LWTRIDKATFLTQNEKRAAVDYCPVDGGDELKGSDPAGLAPSHNLASKFNPITPRPAASPPPRAAARTATVRTARRPSVVHHRRLCTRRVGSRIRPASATARRHAIHCRPRPCGRQPTTIASPTVSAATMPSRPFLPNRTPADDMCSTLIDKGAEPMLVGKISIMPKNSSQLCPS
jgi:hypothetical protein